MKTTMLAAAVASLVAWTPVAAQSPLELQVITASPEGFLVNSTLVTGARDAVLIDAAFTLADARTIVERVRASGKNLTTVYVTHGHPDHYFGLTVIKEAFPKARLVALPATVAAIQGTWKSKVDQWKPVYKDAITSTPVLPTAIEGSAIMLEGQRLEIVGPYRATTRKTPMSGFPRSARSSPGTSSTAGCSSGPLKPIARRARDGRPRSIA